MLSCFLAILSNAVGYIGAKTRDAASYSMTIPGQDADAGVPPTAAVIAFEPKPIESDIDHDALQKTHRRKS